MAACSTSPTTVAAVCRALHALQRTSQVLYSGSSSLYHACQLSPSGLQLHAAFQQPCHALCSAQARRFSFGAATQASWPQRHSLRHFASPASPQLDAAASSASAAVSSLPNSPTGSSQTGVKPTPAGHTAYDNLQLPAVRHYREFTLILHALPPLRAPRSPAEQRCLQAALGVVRRLREHGYTAMFAGGWVRDQFLGRPSPDIDLVSNATYVQVFEVFGPRHCRLKGGTTCDVTWDGHTFEVTSYRGGLSADCEEAEWRDAACRDFTLNALFFDPHLPPAASNMPPAAAPTTTTTPGHAATATTTSSNSSSSSNSSTATTNANGSTDCSTTATESSTTTTAAAAPEVAASAGLSAASPPPPPPPAAPPSLAPPPHLQPPGVVKDYVGGVEDLRAGLLRVFPHHERLGMTASSVEVDPIRVLRAARLAVQFGLRVEPHTEGRVRRAAR
ncbi:hypothetical protein Agub_g5571, partial [Astrephomene gubernaculifera]